MEELKTFSPFGQLGLKSKNSGEVNIGFDIIFKDKKGYELGKKYVTKTMMGRTI
jgi:hypothetical protein